MSLLGSQEGVLLIDHRNSPGVPDAMMVPLGFSVGAGHGLYESATFTCPYCNRVVAMNPKRTRERHFDKKTNHLICDDCKALEVMGQLGKPIAQIADELRSAGAKQGVSSVAYQIPDRQSVMFQSPTIPATPEPAVETTKIIIP